MPRAMAAPGERRSNATSPSATSPLTAAQPEEQLGDFAAAGADQAREAQDLPGAQLEADVVGRARRRSGRAPVATTGASAGERGGVRLELARSRARP